LRLTLALPLVLLPLQELTIVAMGCSERAEEHVLRQTNYWQEISTMMPS
jgi:hypothetical protein